MREKEKNVFKSWVQLSDLHVFEGIETQIIKSSFEKLGEKLAPDFLIVSGDFRHVAEQPDFSKGAKFLKAVAKAFGVEKEDIFIVPGNHDVNVLTPSEKGVRTKKINAIFDERETKGLPSVKDLWKDELSAYFTEYEKFVQDFYGKSIRQYNCALKTVDAFVWKNCLNLIFLNTAIVSNGDRSHAELVDMETLSGLVEEDSAIDKSLPSIVIGHHAPQFWDTEQKAQFSGLKDALNIKAYLCGDAHRVNLVGLSEKEFGFPVFTCGKSAPQPKDKYSDVSVISYKWKNDAKIYVQAYDWGSEIHEEKKYEFLMSNHFMRNIDEPYSFECPLPEAQKKLLRRIRTIDNTNLLIDYKITNADITLVFDSREDITQIVDISFVVNSEKLGFINHIFTWSGRDYVRSYMEEDSEAEGYSIRELSSSQSQFIMDVVFPRELKYNESGRYTLKTEVRDSDHNMNPVLSRGIKCDTDKLTLKVMFSDDLIESCEAFVAFQGKTAIENPVILSKKKMGSKIYCYSYEFSDLRLALRYGLRWKFKESD